MIATEKRPTKPLVVLIWVISAALASAVALSPRSAQAAADDPDVGLYVFRWPSWVKGFDLGLGAFGHFGKSTSLDSPPGGLLIRAQGHAWYQHLAEFHVTLGVGISSSLFQIGGGFKLNLIEYVEDLTGETRAKGVQRGLLSKAVPNFMIYLQLDYNHYGFGQPTTPGITYATSGSAISPGAGVQWYLATSSTSWARRFYVDTSVGYEVVAENNYLLPFVGFGAELK